MYKYYFVSRQLCVPRETKTEIKSTCIFRQLECTSGACSSSPIERAQSAKRTAERQLCKHHRRHGRPYWTVRVRKDGACDPVASGTKVSNSGLIKHVGYGAGVLISFHTARAGSEIPHAFIWLRG